MPKVYLTPAERAKAEEERRLMNLADAIRAKQARKKIKTTELSEMTGISRTVLWDYIDNGGLKKAKFGSVLKILNALEMTAEDLKAEGVLK